MSRPTCVTCPLHSESVCFRGGKQLAVVGGKVTWHYRKVDALEDVCEIHPRWDEFAQSLIRTNICNCAVKFTGCITEVMGGMDVKIINNSTYLTNPKCESCHGTGLAP